MERTLLEMAKDLTRSLVETGKLSAEDMHRTLQQAYTTLSTLKAQEEAGTTSIPMPASPSTAVDWRKSISRQAVTCLECGQIGSSLPSAISGRTALTPTPTGENMASHAPSH